jgi:hypothetical protein
MAKKVDTAPLLYGLWAGANYFLCLVEENLAVETLLCEHLYVVFTFSADH